MARNVVTSERVWNEVRKLVAPREPIQIETRGNYPKGYFRVWLSEDCKDIQYVTIPPAPRKKHRLGERPK